MAVGKQAGDRQSQHVALLGFLLQLVAFALLLGLSVWAGSQLLNALSRFVLVGVPIWLVLYLIYNQIRRAGLEALETEELRRAREAGVGQAIFELDDEALLIDRNRLEWMVYWLLPACTVVVAALLVIGHFALWGWSLEGAFDSGVLKPTTLPTMMMWFVVGVGFSCFLYARYAMALARLPQMGLLRAGAVCMAGHSLACVLVAVGLMASGTMTWAEPVLTYGLRIVLLVMGFEFTANFILDLYRPRVPGEVARPSFDSRLLGLIAEPGGIAKSIADAVNYQFGFQVSSTWFYQLLQRWLFPIVVLAGMVVMALTAVVIVDADEQVIVQRWGSWVAGPDAVLSPGVHLKWPFPIDIVYRAPVKRVSEAILGESESHGHEEKDEAVIWTEQHEFVPEMMLLVAAQRPETRSGDAEPGRQDGDSVAGEESVPVALLMVSVPIEYRIRDIGKYLSVCEDSKKLLESVAYQQLSEYAANVNMDVLIGPWRERFNAEFHKVLQSRLDDLDFGVEIAFVRLRDVHPPAKDNVAAAFQEVVAAETRMSATLRAAEGVARRSLITVAGTEARAVLLDDAIRERDRHPTGSSDYDQADQRVKDLLLGNPEKSIPPCSGAAAAQIAEARVEASSRIGEAASKALAFGAQLAAYRAAPTLYPVRKFLEVFGELDTTRKFLIVGDPTNVTIEYETAKVAGLDQVLSEGLDKERKNRSPGQP